MNRKEFDERINQICETTPAPTDQDKTYFYMREHAQFDFIDSLENENAKLKNDLAKSEEQRTLLSELNKDQERQISVLADEATKCKMEIEDLTKRKNNAKLRFDAIGMQLEDCSEMTTEQALKIKALELEIAASKTASTVDREKVIQSMCHSWFGDGYEATEPKVKKHIFDQMGKMFDSDIAPILGKYLIEESRCDMCAQWDINAIGNSGYGMCKSMGRVTREWDGCEFAPKEIV
jgi:small-conductance mechanosensitive channel